jgi:hypothetical protein
MNNKRNKNKNSTMGFIPSTQDRSVYERRKEYISSLGPIAQLIVANFENNFIGNMVNGFSFAQVLNSFIIDFQAYMNNKTLSYLYWFDSTPSKTIYGIETASYLPKDYNSLFAMDLKYKNLIRTDKKLAPFNYCLGPAKNNLSSNFLYQLYFAIPPNVANNVNYDPSLVLVYSSYNNSDVLIPSSGIDINMSSNTYIYFNNGNISFKLDMSGPAITQTVTHVKFLDLLIYTFTTTPTTSVGVFNLKVISVTYPSLNNVLTQLSDALALITWLESESVAINVEGNYDGIKTDAYEKLLSDQLNYLNTMSDRVENSLIGSKIDGQNQKDAVQAQIDLRKSDLLKVINQKKADIVSMDTMGKKFQSILGQRIIQ